MRDKRNRALTVKGRTKVDVMSEDFFDDTSDADFLALARQIDNGPASAPSDTNRTVPSRPVIARLAPGRSGSSTSGGDTRPGTPKTSSPATRVVRPGFNSIIVNTRQVCEYMNMFANCRKVQAFMVHFNFRESNSGTCKECTLGGKKQILSNF